MLLTVSWPTKCPSYSTTKGSCRPARASRRIERTIAAKLRGWACERDGAVASQRPSQASVGAADAAPDRPGHAGRSAAARIPP